MGIARYYYIFLNNITLNLYPTTALNITIFFLVQVGIAKKDIKEIESEY